ncbi:sulfite exporter TauE/SafE family protein [Ponticoccus alexandrii]|uniref:Probable membrane transporter protein n=1 Tax=Ponticoccus alexandrii TaxID=1943633 RepID=A0ABX7FCY2_9RHOB|nr:sulfite exporter TauE/SafE family protein [Ponticoccus alexandrii]KID12403.1 membrane protein [Rhodobacteraceae bacterium PD-2]QRF67227.1 TSUP family transporter [Ponticoccus alexandrii]
MTLDLSTLAPLVAVLMAASAVAGLLAGLFGVGGGIILVPAFYFVLHGLGYDGPQVMQVCLATSLASIIVTSIRSVHAHNKRGAVDWDILKGWAPGIAIGAVLGMLAAARLRSEVLAVIFGVLATMVGLYLAFGRQSWRLGPQMPQGGTRAALSPTVGFFSVLMGIGGGSFGVPLMTLYSVPMHRAVATAAGFGLVIAVPSVIGFLFLNVAGAPPLTVGAVNVPALVIAISMTLITAPMGAKLAHALDALLLRRLFAVFILIVAVNMLRKALWA